jgi:hypothetical protein
MTLLISPVKNYRLYLPANNTLRILVVLIEQDGATGSTDWPAIPCLQG